MARGSANSPKAAAASAPTKTDLLQEGVLDEMVEDEEDEEDEVATGAWGQLLCIALLSRGALAKSGPHGCLHGRRLL